MDDNRHTNDRFGDTVDQADIQQQRLLDAKIKEITSQVIDMSNPSQECWHCGDQTPSVQHRWCDHYCMSQWSKDHD